MPKLTRVPPRPASWAHDGPDLLYVSNASGEPQDLIRDAIDSVGGQALHRRVIEDAAQRIMAVYAEGRSLPTMGEVGAVLDDALRDARVAHIDRPIRVRLVNLLYHPLNDALYRQQALGWVADAARDMGLSFEIYGRGWEQRERFAAFARGPVGYGEPLEKITRRAKLCLQIVPSFCLHQRLLDGLVAGGFFLVRQHTSDTTLPALAQLLHRHADPAADGVDAALASCNASHRDELRRLVDQAALICDFGSPMDVVLMNRLGVTTGSFPLEGQALPHLDEISFDGAGQLRERIGRFLDAPDLRREIAQAQRLRVEQALTYRAGMRRLMRTISQKIASETRAAA